MLVNILPSGITFNVIWWTGTNASEEHAVSDFRIEQASEEHAVSDFRIEQSSSTFEERMLVCLYHAILCHIPEDLSP